MVNLINPLAGALYMYGRGFKVFPLKANRKDPEFTGWQEWAENVTENMIRNCATSDPTRNWGVYLGATGHMVLDIDNKHGKDGSKALSDLTINNTNLPQTLTVITPNRGVHYYFVGTGISREDSLANGVDVKSTGGYVVAPGSVIDEVPYEVSTEADIPTAPPWVLELANKTKENAAKPVKTKVPLELLNQDNHVDAAVKYLKTEAPASVSGENGNATLYKAACHVRDLGVATLDLCKGLMAVHYDPRCQPPWLLDPNDEARWEKTIRSAYNYAQNTPGAKTKEAKQIEAKEDFMQDYKGPLSWDNFTGEAPKRDWLIPNWLPLNEISSLYGKGGSGKSLLSLQLAAAAAAGSTFMGLDVPASIPTLCVYCEDSKEELHRRFEAIVSAAETSFAPRLAASEFLLWPRVGENNDLAKESDKGNDVVNGSFYPQLDRALSEMPPGNKLLILDTLSDIYLGNENDRGKVNKFIKTILGGLKNKYSLTVLMLAHPSRTGANTGDQLSGSTQWENSVRNRLTFVSHKKFPEVTVLTRVKSNYAKQGETLPMKWIEGRFALLNAEERRMLEGHDERAMYAEALHLLFKQDPEPRSAAALSNVMVNSDTVAHLFHGHGAKTVAEKLKAYLAADLEFEGSVFEGAKKNPNLTNSPFIVSLKVQNIEELDDQITGDEALFS